MELHILLHQLTIIMITNILQLLILHYLQLIHMLHIHQLQQIKYHKIIINHHTVQAILHLQHQKTITFIQAIPMSLQAFHLH
jgi:hypothetical protein